MGCWEEAGVATIAGTSFGAYGEGYLRLSYAASTEEIEESIARIEGWLAERARQVKAKESKRHPAGSSATQKIDSTTAVASESTRR